MHPKLLKELLLSFLGETSHDSYKEEFDIEEIEKLEAYLKNVEKKPAASESAAELSKLLQSLDDTATMQFLQGISTDELAKVIADLNGDVQIKLFNNLPKRGTFLMLDAIKQQNSLDAREKEEALAKVVAIINELQHQA
jgi:flagellar motor switch protein FliG